MKDRTPTRQQPAAIGRPSSYTPEIAEKLCAEIAEGGILHRMCRRDDMPDHSTVFRWLEGNDEFRDRYCRARERQAEFFADEIIEIVDTEPDPQIARVRMDARKWHASKTAPKKYGDRITTELTGANGGPMQVEPVNPLEVLEAKLARLTAARARE